MTESVMYFGIGFALATLIGLLVVLPVYHRALRSSVEQSRADVHQLEQQLAVALAERSTLQREIAAIKRDAEKTWTSERIESALFRERINDVADEVARITQALKSPGSLIEPVSGYVAPATGTKRLTGRPAINSASGEAGTNTGALADRICALRTVASRATANQHSMEVRYDPPDFRRRMLTAERRSGNEIFAQRQSADDDRVEANLSDEARCDINSVRVVAGDRNADEFALPVRGRRQLGIVDRVEGAHDMRAREQFRRR